MATDDGHDEVGDEPAGSGRSLAIGQMLALAEDGFNFEDARDGGFTLPFLRVGRRKVIKRFEFTDDQSRAFRTIMDAAEDRSGERHLIILEAAQGTGKTLVLLAALDCLLQRSLRARGRSSLEPARLYFQGQTMQRWVSVLPPRIDRAVMTWDGGPTKAGTPVVARTQVSMVDEAHLMFPWRPRSMGSTTFGPNKGSYDARLDSLKAFAHLVATDQTAAVTDSDRVPVLWGIAEQTDSVMVVVRDPDQVVDPRAMTDEEFEVVVGMLEHRFGPAQRLTLGRQQRTSSEWVQFVDALFQPGTVPLKGIRAQFEEHLTGSGRFVTGDGFIGQFTDRATELRAHADAQQHGDDDFFRFLATFSWPDQQPFTVGRSASDEVECLWAGHGIPNGAARNKILARWPNPATTVRGIPTAVSYAWGEDGLGYLKVVQGQEFGDTAVIIGPHLRWEGTVAEGRWTLDPDRWQFTSNHRRFSSNMRNSMGADVDRQLLACALREARILLGRARSTCWFYVDDHDAQVAIAGLMGTP